MVPFIDVMLVLLIIFMVSAPLITTGMVDLPSVGASNTRPPIVIEVIVDKNGSYRIKTSASKDTTAVKLNLNQIASKVRELQQGDAQMPVVISADREVRYEAVMDAMGKLKESGVARVGLSVKQSKVGAP